MQLAYTILCTLLGIGSMLFWVDRFCNFINKESKFLSNKFIFVLGLVNLGTIFLFLIFFKIWNESKFEPIKYIPVKEQFYKIETK
jgi:hypothetical protein